jgi:hypothetical protein
LERQKPPNRRITLTLSDEEPMAAAARIAGGSYSSKELPPPRKTRHVLRIGERQAVNRIAERGMDRPKLTLRAFPDLPYPAAFLRGAFDGDGSAGRYLQTNVKHQPYRDRLQCFLFGGPVFLQGVVDFLATQGIKSRPVHPRRGKPIYYVQWSHKDSLRLAEIMYSDPGPYMERKWAKFYANPERF